MTGPRHTEGGIIDTLPNIYMARMDVAPEGLPAFMNWYEHKHAPDLISVGFHSAHGYHCRAGSPFILNVYEIDSSEIFYSEAYNTKRTPASDPERPAILAGVTNRSNTVYRQIHTLGVEIPDRSWSEGSRSGAVDAPVVTSVRFDLEQGSNRDALVDWFRDVEFPRTASRSGFLAARLLNRTGRQHHANPWLSSWATLIEWEDQVAAEAAGDEVGTLERLTGAGLGVTEAAFHLAVRVLSVTTGGGEPPTKRSSGAVD